MINEIIIISIIFLAQSFFLFCYFETIYDKGRSSKNNDKYRKQIQDLQNALERKNKHLKGVEKGMKKMQSKYDKLKQENKCLKKQLCKEV